MTVSWSDCLVVSALALGEGGRTGRWQGCERAPGAPCLPFPSQAELGADLGFMKPEAYTSWGIFKKIIQNWVLEGACASEQP